MAQIDNNEATAAPILIAQPASVQGFAILCVQKAVEFNVTDHKLHRASKDKELHEELEKLTVGVPSTYLYQLGGGCRVVGTCGAGGVPMSSACVGDSVAAFQGHLSNLLELAQTYMPEVSADVETVTPAEVICHMYTTLGVDLLTKLRGRFAFCLYESKQGRVLAARDGSGAVHLYQGNSPAEGLVVASTRGMLSSCTNVRPFAPGDFKYGWHAEPRQFSPTEFSRRRTSHPSGPRIDRSSIKPVAKHDARSHPTSPRQTPPLSPTANMSQSLGSAVKAGGSASKSGGNRDRRPSSGSSGSSQDGYSPSSVIRRGNGSGAASWRATPPQSPSLSQLRTLDINAKEFKPTWCVAPALAAQAVL